MLFLKKAAHAALVLVICYLVYVLAAGVLPYLCQPEVDAGEKQRLDVERFYVQEGDGPCADRVALVETPQEAFDTRIRMIAEARERLDIVYHCVKDGETSEQFFSQVINAADRGVKVRLLLDGKVGGMGGERQGIALALASHPNIEYRVYNPIHVLKPWEWNALLHDKFILVDNRLMLLGGRNIGDEYFNPEGYTGSVTYDRDVLVYHTDPDAPGVLDEARAYLEEDLWNVPEARPAFGALSAKQGEQAQAAAQELRRCDRALRRSRPALFSGQVDYTADTLPAGKVSLIHNPTHAGPKQPWVGWQLAQMALRAQDEILLQSPYTTGSGALLRTFREVGKGDADFTLVTNSMASSPNLPAFSCYLFERKHLAETGVRIYEYQSTDSIHGKSYLFDGRLCAVGSLNLDDRSLYIDTESMLVIDSPAFYQELSGAINGYRAQALLVGPDNRYVPDEAVAQAPVPALKRGLMHVASWIFRVFQFLV